MNVSRKFRDRPHMKALFVSRYQRPKNKTLVCMYDIAIISDDDKYLEYAIGIDKDKNLTYYQLTRFRSIFNKWKVDIHTAVVMTNTITVKHPLYIFFQILSHQIGFTLFRINMDVVARGVSKNCPSYIQKDMRKGKYIRKPAAEISISNIRVLWQKLIKHKRCPWINYEVDRYIRTKNNDFIKRKQWVRLGGLYLVFKLKNKEYVDRRHIRDKLLTDRQALEAASDRQDSLQYPKLTPRFYGPNDPLLKELEEFYGKNPTSGRVAEGYDDLPTIMTPDENDSFEPEQDVPPELNGN